MRNNYSVFFVFGILIAYYIFMNKSNKNDEIASVDSVSRGLSAGFLSVFTIAGIISEMKITGIIKKLYIANKYLFALSCVLALFSFVFPICATAINQFNTILPKSIKGNDVKLKLYIIKRKTQINTISTILFLISFMLLTLMVINLYF